MQQLQLLCSFRYGRWRYWSDSQYKFVSLAVPPNLEIPGSHTQGNFLLSMTHKFLRLLLAVYFRYSKGINLKTFHSYLDFFLGFAWIIISHSDTFFSMHTGSPIMNVLSPSHCPLIFYLITHFYHLLLNVFLLKFPSKFHSVLWPIHILPTQPSIKHKANGHLLSKIV